MSVCGVLMTIARGALRGAALSRSTDSTLSCRETARFDEVDDAFCHRVAITSYILAPSTPPNLYIHIYTLIA